MSKVLCVWDMGPTAHVRVFLMMIELDSFIFRNIVYDLKFEGFFSILKGFNSLFFGDDFNPN